MDGEKEFARFFGDIPDDDVDTQSKVVESAREYYRKFTEQAIEKGAKQRDIGRMVVSVISNREIPPTRKAMLLMGQCVLDSFGKEEKHNLWTGGKKFVEQMERYNTEKRSDGSWKYIGWGGTVNDETGVVDIDLQHNRGKGKK